MAASIKASPYGISTVDVARKHKGWNKSDPRWCEAASVSSGTLKRFWRGTAISRDTFISICEAVDVDWKAVTELGSDNLKNILKQGTEAWNEWKRQNPPLGYNFDNEDLRGLDLNGVDFSYTSLVGANLSGANLERANLTKADLSGANFNGANLRGVNLKAAQALSTVLTGVKLTGACIEDWNIDSDTQFENVSCDYIFLQCDHNNRWKERRPSSGNFAPGDFSKLVQKAVSTVDLIFRGGIDWKAFAKSFQKLQVTSGTDELNIQSIENKGNGDFVIRVNTPPGADKAAIQKFVEKEYEKESKAIEANYQALLKVKDEQIAFQREQLAFQRQENTNLWEMTKMMASRPSNVEVNTVVSSSDERAKAVNYDMRGASFVGSSVSTSERELDNAVIIDTPSLGEKDSHEAVNKLIESLKSFSQTFPEEQREETEIVLEDLENDLNDYRKRNPNRLKRRLKNIWAITSGIGANVTNTEKFNNNVLDLANVLDISRDEIQASQEAKIVSAEVVEDLEQLNPHLSQLTAAEALKQIEAKPAFKKRVIAALKAGGVIALEETINHPAAAFVLAAVAGWKEFDKS